MASFLSRLQSDLRHTLVTKRGATHLPEQVPRGEHKVYARMQQIPLGTPAMLGMPLTEALARRASSVSKEKDAPISLPEYSALLGNGLKKRESGVSRNYPSGGALYPIETYLIAESIEGIESGVFHYNPTAHTLERLWSLPKDFAMTNVLPNPEGLSSSALIVFTSVWQRSSAKYGDLAYQHALLEAGHMSENILLLAAALGLDARPMAGFIDARIIELLDLDADNEQPVHTILLSKENGRS